jgi:hypothetical protein
MPAHDFRSRRIVQTTAPSPDPTSDSSPGVPPPGWAAAIRTGQASLPFLSQRGRRVETRAAGTSPLASTLRAGSWSSASWSTRTGTASVTVATGCTDARTAGEFRVWVRDLRTGVTDEIGGPYGFPIDKFHPADGEDLGIDGTMSRHHLLVLPRRQRTAHCEQRPSASSTPTPSSSTRGRDPGWDFAPDAAWLRSRKPPHSRSPTHSPAPSGCV